MIESKADSGSPALWVQSAGILLAAVVLGLIYNSASPLRVRQDSPGVPSTTSAGSPVVKPAIVRTGVFNETLSLTLELPPGPMAAPVRNPAPSGPANPVVAAHQTSIPALKWPEVKALLDAGKIVLVDARLKANFDLGHIPGAVLLPATSSADELRAFADKYPKQTALVTYCGSDSCHMSHALAESLIKICGFTNVSHMPGGYAEYTLAVAATK